MAIDDIEFRSWRKRLPDGRHGVVGTDDPAEELDASGHVEWRAHAGALARWRDARLAVMAYEIHDGLAQHVAAAQMRLETLLDADGALSEHARREIQVSLALIRKATSEARHLMGGLYPPMVDDLDVVAALERMIRELPPGGPSVELSHEGQWEDLDAPLENAIFRVIQEAVTNATRHSRSRRVVVRMTRTDEMVRLEVRDWGVGFDTTDVGADRYGLHGLHERSRLLGGRTRIESGPGEGTRVVVELPIAPARGKPAQEEFEWE